MVQKYTKVSIFQSPIVTTSHGVNRKTNRKFWKESLSGFEPRPIEVDNIAREYADY